MSCQRTKPSPKNSAPRRLNEPSQSVSPGSPHPVLVTLPPNHGLRKKRKKLFVCTGPSKSVSSVNQTSEFWFAFMRWTFVKSAYLANEPRPTVKRYSPWITTLRRYWPREPSATITNGMAYVCSAAEEAPPRGLPSTKRPPGRLTPLGRGAPHAVPVK